jgi:hypothetical protein
MLSRRLITGPGFGNCLDGQPGARTALSQLARARRAETMVNGRCAARTTSGAALKVLGYRDGLEARLSAEADAITAEAMRAPLRPPMARGRSQGLQPRKAPHGPPG